MILFRPLLFFGIATVLAAAYSHGGKYLMKDLGDMSKMPLTHYISSHLSVIYSSVVPILLIVSWTIFLFGREYVKIKLASFEIKLKRFCRYFIYCNFIKCNLVSNLIHFIN